MLETIGSIIAFICAVYVIYNVWVANPHPSMLGKIGWTVAAVIFNIITAIVYYFVGNKTIDRR